MRCDTKVPKQKRRSATQRARISDAGCRRREGNRAYERSTAPQESADNALVAVTAMVMSKSGWYSGMLHVAACRALRIRLLPLPPLRNETVLMREVGNNAALKWLRALRCWRFYRSRYCVRRRAP